MNLTEREKEIIKLMVYPNTIIAKTLNIKLSTVKRHVHNIFNKFSEIPQNRNAMVLYAIKKKVINIEDVMPDM